MYNFFTSLPTCANRGGRVRFKNFFHFQNSPIANSKVTKKSDFVTPAQKWYLFLYPEGVRFLEGFQTKQNMVTLPKSWRRGLDFRNHFLNTPSPAETPLPPILRSTVFIFVPRGDPKKKCTILYFRKRKSCFRVTKCCAHFLFQFVLLMRNQRKIFFERDFLVWRFYVTKK